MSDSPVKKINFNVLDKENAPFDAATAIATDIKEPVIEEVKKDSKALVAPTIKPVEIDEPLLQENPNRFVLFPIKYHEVRDAFYTSARQVYFLTYLTRLIIDLADVQEA